MLQIQKIQKSQKNKYKITALVVTLYLATCAPCFAAGQAGENTGLPLPRFVSLKSNNINARSGPGENYPIKAVYKRAGLPVEIVAEFKLWREIVDVEGEHNWVHKAMLSGNRSAIVTQEAYAYSNPNNSSPVAKLEKDAQIWLEECKAMVCKMKTGKVSGWVEKAKLWGVYANEIFD
jgi:SH3-like domain-containing protein